MTGINPTHLRTYVIRPALFIIGLGGDAAEELMLGTALQESHGGEFLAQFKGPARGVWQMELATHDDIWANYLGYHPQLADDIRSLRAPGLDGATQLPSNMLYACAMARMSYARHPVPLPAAGDLNAQAAFYKTYYNTTNGSATTAEYIANWRAAFPPSPLVHAV